MLGQRKIRESWRGVPGAPQETLIVEGEKGKKVESTAKPCFDMQGGGSEGKVREG